MKSVVVISGATSGLGNELLRTLLSNHIPTIAIGRRIDRLAQQFGADIQNLVALEADLAKSTDLQWLRNLEMCLETKEFRQIVLLSNAGDINPIGLVGENAADEMEKSLNVNLLAPMLLASTCVRLAKALCAELLVLNISSGAAHKPIPGWSAYCSAKAGARMFFDTLASEYPETVVVRHIDPGVLDTAMQRQIRESPPARFPAVQDFIALKSDGRLKPPSLVAAEIVASILSGMPK